MRFCMSTSGALRGGVMALVLGVLLVPGSYAAFSSTDGAAGSLTSASSFYAADVLADGAAGYWRLDAPTVTDSAGTHNGATVGTVSAVPGATPDGDAAVKTTTPGEVCLPWTVAGDASVELSFKVAAATATVGDTSAWYAVSPLVSTAVASHVGDFGIGLDSAGDLVAGSGAVTIASAGVDFRDGAWHHLVWSRDAGTGDMALYADGVVVASGTGGAGPLSARPTLSLGVDPSFSAPAGAIPPPLAAGIDDVATYSSVLTPAQVAAHDAALGAGYQGVVLADSPAGYWRLDDSSGPTAAAAIGSDGTYVGSISYGIGGAVAGDPGVQLLSTAGYLAVPRLVSADFSLEFWFKDAAPVEDGHVDWSTGAALVDGDVPGVHDDFGVSIDASGHVMAGVGNPDTTIHASAADYGDSAWHYVVFTRTMSTGALHLYVDGALQAVGAGNTGLLNAASLLTVGAGSTGAGGSAAVIDEVAEYPTVLTPAQVLAHYQQAS
jgi:Concanavalin A-like lectin/glucanases superfamily